MRRALVVAVALAWACEVQEQQQLPPGSSKSLEVYAVNEPLRYFAERIGGDAMRVTLPVPADVDPAHWSPDAETVAAFQGADLILRNGAGYAKWVSRASLPRAAQVDTSAAFRERLESGQLRVEPGREGEVAVCVRAVSDALARAVPASADDFQHRFKGLRDDLKALDERLAQAAERLAGAPLLFSHPVYEYLVRRYALNARSVHWEPDALPGAPAWRELEDLLQEHPARWMLWEADPLEETRWRLELLGVRSAVFDPCGNVPPEGDWLSVMQRNAATLEDISE